jgi:hypothetical protein
VGFYFEPASGASIRDTLVPVNEPRTVKVLGNHQYEVSANYIMTIAEVNHQTPAQAIGDLVRDIAVGV